MNINDYDLGELERQRKALYNYVVFFFLKIHRLFFLNKNPLRIVFIDASKQRISPGENIIRNVKERFLVDDASGGKLSHLRSAPELLVHFV